jgi:hypothetical protein
MKNTILKELAEVVRGPVGYTWVRQQKLDPTLPAYSVAGWADSILSDAIKCLLVGMEAECLELLAKSDQWMMTALQRFGAGEPTTDEEDGHHLDLALCRWLEGPPAVPPDLTRARHLLAQQAAAATALNHRSVFEWVLPLWLDADRDAECVAAFERFEPRYPPARRRHHAPSAMAYLLARQQVRHTLSGEELVKLIDDFMARHVPWMFDHGCYTDFARWVKLTTGAEAGAAARTAVREVAQRYMR